MKVTPLAERQNFIHLCNYHPPDSYEKYHIEEELPQKSSATCDASEGQDNAGAVEEKPAEDDHCCVAGENEVNEDDVNNDDVNEDYGPPR